MHLDNKRPLVHLCLRPWVHLAAMSVFPRCDSATKSSGDDLKCRSPTAGQDRAERSIATMLCTPTSLLAKKQDG